MANSFVLTAQLQMAGPKNLGAVVSTLQRSLGKITANINVKVAPSASTNIANLNKNVAALNTNLRSLRISAGQAAAAIATLGRAANLNNASLATAAASLTSITKSLNTVSKAAKTSTDSIEDFGAKSALALKRFAAFSIATAGILGFVGAAKNAFVEALQFERELVKVAQVTGKTIKELSGLTNEVSRLSTTFGVSSKSLVNVAQVLAQAGLTARDTRIALEALAKTELSPTFEDINQTTEGAIAIMRQFGVEAGQLESTLSSLNAVAGQFAVESSDIIAAVRRAGGAFKAAGGNFNEFIALFTSVRQTTRESAESIATGFRTIFTRFQRPGTVKFLSDLGVQLTDIEGKFVGPFEAVGRLSEALNKLDPRDLRFAQIIEELGGFRQVSKVIPLIQQFGVAQKALGVAQRGTNTLTQDAETAQQSLLVQLQKVKEEFLKLFRVIANNNAVRGFLDLTASLVSNLTRLASALEPVLPALTVLGSIKLGGAIGSFGKGFLGRNKGGPIPRFARGGMVPGQGNGDTVPALLQPGEFVLRKKAVQAIGAGNLKGINRYASGGPVREFGVAALQPTGLKEPFEATVAVPGQRGPGSKQKVKIFAGGIDKTVAKQSEKYIEDEITKVVINLGRSIETDIGTTQSNSKNLPKILRGAGFYGAVGNIFESALAVAGAPYEDKGSANAPIDFPKGLGRLASRFGFRPNQAKIPTDATRTFGSGGKKIGRFLGQVGRFLAKEAAGTLGPKKVGVADSGLLTAALGAKKGSLFTAAQLGDSAKNLKANAQVTSNFEILRRGGKEVFRKLAKGGAAGTDTVPALLTPGEFVINKKAASRIGMANLQKMNKVERFAAGGPVGGGSGGISAFQAGGALLFVLPQITSYMGELGEKINELIAIVVAATAAFFALNNGSGGLRDIATNFRHAFGKNQVPGGIGPTVPGNFRRRAGARLAGNLAAPLGVAATIGGGLLSSAGNDRIAKGDASGVGLAKAGGALSGAGTGAAVGATLGSFFGPIGTAIGGLAGALIGGITGFITSAKEAEKQLAAVKFEKIFDSLTTSLDRVSSGRFTAASQAGNIARGLQASQQRLLTASPEESKSLRAQLEQQAIGLQTFTSKLAETTNTIATFDTGFSKTILEFQASLLGIPTEQLRSEIEKEIKARLSSIEAIGKVNIAMSQLAVQANFARDFSAAIKDAADSASRLDKILETIASGGAQAGGVRGFGDIFSRGADGGVINTRRLQQAASQVTAGFGRPGQSLANSATSAAELTRALPGILQNIRGRDALNPEQLLDNLEGQLQNFPAFLRDKIVAAAGEITQGERGDVTFLNRIDSDVGLLTKELTAGFEGFFTTLEDAANQLEAANSRLAGQFESRNKILERIQDLQIKNSQIGLDVTKATAEARGKELPLGVTLQALAQQQAITAGPKFANIANNPQALGQALSQVQQQLVAKQAQRDNAGFGNIGPLNEDIANLSREARNLQDALENLGNPANKLAAIQEKLAKAQSDRATKFDFAKDLIFGGPKDRLNLGTGVNEAQFAARNNSIAGLSVEGRNRARGILERFGEVKTSLFGNRTGNEVLRDIVSKELSNVTVDDGKGGKRKLNKDEIDSIAGISKEEDTLIKAMQDAAKQAQAANNELAKNFGASADTLLTGIRESFNQFLTDLAANFKQANVTKIQSEINNLQGQQNKRKVGLDAARRISRLGIRQDEAKAIRARLPSIQQAIADKKKLEGIQNSGFDFSRDIKADNIRPDFVDKALFGFGGAKVVQKVKAADSPEIVKDVQALEKNLNNLGLKGLTSQAEVDQGFLNRALSSRQFTTQANKFGINPLDVRQQLAGKTDTAEVATIINDLFRGAFQNAVTDAQQSKVQAVEGLTDRGGSVVGNVIAGKIDVNKFSDVLTKLPDDVNKLNAEFRATAQRIAELRKELQALGNGNGGGGAPQGFASGGVVRPRGTDTVPAMLTPGEFVLNRAATNRIGINNLKRFNSGGPVGNTAVGGDMGSFVESFSNTINTFNNASNNLANALNNFPRSITIEGRTTHEVIHNGLDIVKNIGDVIEAKMKDVVVAYIKDLVDDRLQGSGPPVVRPLTRTKA